MPAIKIQGLTKDYGNNKGIFGVSFHIEEGEVFGFLGPNGAGKTTTIRHLLGFTKPQSGTSTILGLDSWKQSKEIHQHLGYLPAEIAFPANMTGAQIIQHAANMRGLKDMTLAQELITMFDLDPSPLIKRMSKGMKQKVGIVCAFIHDPKILILDEPTTGLDPLMQSVFVTLIHREKQKGKSILMSSHHFEEIEGTCDRIAMIRQGRLTSALNSQDFKHFDKTTYKITFRSLQDFHAIQKEEFTITDIQSEALAVLVEIEDLQINELIGSLGKKDVLSIREMKVSLEDSFMNFYKQGDHDHV
ncbi:ABC transporter ATP-binding protein [Jeotgalibacillus proteolyticus]|uniref:ABC transporter ATP-binding protein n=1 Tax=Jeotgalibacillus proteolyticus TaxID=2082395 RepID=A0A2S5GBT8_9BACL|nr:ABC transporter ATP-binding protein [Jeotgalibacillus proteolyticus]PPA70459.1 ABC transporter ATP-binding protein [Jeotgalibacillus proteolyticus]